MSTRNVSITTASDYAGLTAGRRSFYYGYEYDRDTEDDAVWGFEYKNADSVIARFSYDEMATEPGCPDRFETQECLLFGIGIVLAKVIGG